MATTTESVTDLCRRARAASLLLPAVPTAAKNDALAIMARMLRERADEVLEANAVDVERGRSAGLDDALLDRLGLDHARIEAMAAGVEAIIELPDPIGEELDHRTLASGIELEHKRVPLGVIAIIYEARPNVTIDAAALCLKSGNASLLRGSSTAAASNAVLGGLARDAVREGGLPEGTIEIVGGGSREELSELARQRDLVDLIIPRGGEGLKRSLEQVAEVPILYAASGNCHVYVHSDADLEMARVDRLQREGEQARRLQRRRDAARPRRRRCRLPARGARRAERSIGASWSGTRRAAPRPMGSRSVPPRDDDWDTEYHALKLAVAVVDSLDAAIEHINRHGSGHSEAIVTSSEDAAGAFTSGVDAACVYVNASTRFTDGFEFGMGAEIGNSTQKLHARGPIGLRELTSTKYVLRGSGQIRA